ncbi:hypothetical protein IWW49_002408 [Coemansia sp. RSA 1797]|nr:hypothetical protein IWW49_002408 [Coemansia sp. RSA 1797]
MVTPQNKYTLNVPGHGTCTSSSIGKLKVGGHSLEQLLESSTSGALSEQTVWLDIESPTPRDVHSITKVFNINHSIVQHMYNISKQPTAGQLEPTCQQSNDQLYLCLTEPAITEHTIHTWCNTRNPAQTDGPRWSKANENHNAKQRERRLEQIKALLDTSHAHTRGSRSNWRVARQWGHEKWQSMLRADHDARISRRNSINISNIYVNVQLPFQTHVVRVWTRGRIVVTLHSRGSWTVERTRDALNKCGSGCESADRVLQTLVSSWVHNSHTILGHLHTYSDVLAEQTSRPQHPQPRDINEWATCAHRAHTLALYLLRHSHATTHVLRRLHTYRPTRALKQLLSQQNGTVRAYAHVEQRLAHLNNVVFARLRQQLLLAGTSILDAMNVCLVAHLVAAPLQLWTNVDNLNGITTPGRLLGDDGRMFYWQFLVFAVWTVCVCLVCRIHINRHKKMHSKKTQHSS